MNMDPHVNDHGGGGCRPAAGVGSDASVEAVVDAMLAASRALVALSARSIASSGGVTLPQFRMLVVLESASTNLTGLADALDVAPSTAMRMVDRMVAAKLVARTVRPENRRETHLSLTAKGRRTLRTVMARRRRDLSAIITEIPIDQRAGVARAMEMLSAAAEEIWPGASAAVP